MLSQNTFFITMVVLIFFASANVFTVKKSYYKFVVCDSEGLYLRLWGLHKSLNNVAIVKVVMHEQSVPTHCTTLYNKCFTVTACRLGLTPIPR